jgi:hypothetical protein
MNKGVKKKNPAAVALAKLRAKKLTPERRKEISVGANAVRAVKLTQEQRQEIARNAAEARWGKRRGTKAAARSANKGKAGQ